MAEKVFLQILNMSYTASYVIIFVMIARLLLKKAPKLFSYVLWSVVLFRLVCPFSFASIWSLIPEDSTSLPIDTNYSKIAQINTGVTAIDYTNNPALPVQASVAGVNPIQGWITIGEIIWLIGITVLLLYSVVSLLRLRWKLVGAVKLRGNIYLADHINSPFVMGVMRPKIYLPSTLSEQEQRYTILHEQTHIRRLDHMVKILAFAGLAVHWFNPLVWAAFILFGNDMEMSCDESVMKQMDTDIRGDYSALLLGLATGRKVTMGVPLAFCEGDVKGRIKNVMNYKKPAFWVVIVTLITVIIVVTGLLANPHTNKASMQWAKKLSVRDVEKIELIVMPSSENEKNRLLDDVEFDDIIALINESRGKYIENPEELAGGSTTYYITLTDGTRHFVSNSGNRYLIIDGDYYDAGYNWLSSWNYANRNSVSPSATPTSPMITSYSNDGIKFDYPSDWTIREHPTEDIYYVSFHNSNSGDEPVFWYSKGEAWLTGFDRTEEVYKTLLSESYKNIDITELTKTTMDGYDSIKLVFTYTLKGKEYVMTQYETVIGYASFQFNYTHPTNKSTENESIFESIISSIKFTLPSTDKTVDKNKDNANKVSDNNDVESGNIDNGSIKDLGSEEILQYLNTTNGILLKQTADSFVKAYFSGDEDTIDQYLAADNDYSGNKVYQVNGVAINVYEKLPHLVAKWYSASDETAEIQYEHKLEGVDSYTYMDVQLEYSDGKWLVTEFYFEK